MNLQRRCDFFSLAKYVIGRVDRDFIRTTFFSTISMMIWLHSDVDVHAVLKLTLTNLTEGALKLCSLCIRGSHELVETSNGPLSLVKHKGN